MPFPEPEQVRVLVLMMVICCVMSLLHDYYFGRKN